MLSTSARLLRLASLLQSRRHWAGAALAAELGVDARTVRRDVDRLRELGYPVEASSGVGGGYALGRGAELPPLMLDDDEAVTLALALRAASANVGGLEDAALALLAKLDQAYKLTGTPNGEIAMRWYPLAIRSGYTQAQEAAGEFIQRVGRRKLILPIYKALVATPDGLAFAEQVFAKAKPGYHPITTASVQDMLAKAEGGAK